MNTRYSKFLPLFTFISDLLLLNMSLALANVLGLRYVSNEIDSKSFILLVNLSWVSVTAFTRSFITSRPLSLSAHLNRFISTMAYHLVLVLGIVYFLKLYEVSRWVILLTYNIFFCVIVVQRSIIFFTLDFIRKKGYNRRNIVVIGNEAVSGKLVRSFSKHPEYGYHFIDHISEEQLSKYENTGIFDRILSAQPHEVFFCYKTINEDFLNELISWGNQHLIKIKLVSDLSLASTYAKVVTYDNLPVWEVSSTPEISLKIRLFKRAFDIGFALSAIIIGFPIFVLLAIITKLTSKGPVFFSQERIGRNRRPFTIYKFRSMYVNAEQLGPQLSSANDPRITPWGRILRKTRLDEIPQFFNVLKGDMSVVGPRPERQHYIEQLLSQSPNYVKLFRLKPGLTSIGQVNYGYAENVQQMKQRLRYDLIYLDNVTFNNDIGIIIKTVKVMTQLKGK